MAKYIDAELIAQRLADMAVVSRKLYPGLMTAYSQVKAASAADVRPERHGEWKGYTTSAFHGVDEFGDPIYRDVNVWKCSECNRKSVVKENYCPNCGAMMDGKENENEIST